MANAELAGRILDAIEAQPAAFNMNDWHSDHVWDEETKPLSPDSDPACGTTLCVAGWAAHLTGWTLQGIVATKPNGEEDYTDDVGQEALGLDTDTAGALFYSTADVALEILRSMAGRAEADANG
jgi:hypothetical protein